MSWLKSSSTVTRTGTRVLFLSASQRRASSHSSLASGSVSGHRQLLSQIWIPTAGIAATEGEDGHGKLIRAGFIRQAQSGIFQMLPMGLRVQQKVERLLDKCMQSIGASRLSLSTLSTEELWQKSNRLDKVAPELFRLQDRKKTRLLLSPTHEEEVTSLVAASLHSYKDLPVRLYQTTRKYRDEMRPRHGLLRSREFVMTDLYTFDLCQESAIDTYQQISGAYSCFFEDLKLPVLVAKANSGDMGGDLSHEYHLSHSVGSDVVAVCRECGHAVAYEAAAAAQDCHGQDGQNTNAQDGDAQDTDAQDNLLGPAAASTCRECVTGSLQLQRGLELGHTFYLGTRYSEPLGLCVPTANTSATPVHMGCYGIGVSRLIGAVAELKADERGLQWPRPMAPFEVAVVPSSPKVAPKMLSLYDDLASQGLDVVLDDRDKRFGWKMRDADLAGYPVIVVLGRAWHEDATCEVQCRSLDIKQTVTSEALPEFVAKIVSRL
ncbi:hypothetical protein CDD81_5580 [Ophiocordyceps australis]|uniref:proline--tRNA ligase n=1 Tax=Ophiocordyceps australis TaxID=1399860 RepID=A0A2C5XIC6_9HYPO|nr:hypothetical protein CDD81_5580 [Ophiocordyceps australis]